MPKMLRIALFGPQGSGKGTQAEMLAKKYNLPVLSTGEVFRKEIKEQTELGKMASDLINRGQLVPDEITNGIVLGELRAPKYQNGFILDGYPRNMNQLDILEKNIGLDWAILLLISDEEVQERLASRRVCSSCGAIYNIINKPSKKEEVCDICGGKLITRDDDKPEAIAKRLQIYHRETEQIINYYTEKGKIIKVDGAGLIEEVFEKIVEKLGK
ncbi:adenylate kinase [Candidatus Falkowbacteria bacterium]|nr:adenylate kinase [Candidatus Falkowbacteria bacterium]